jgi:hypothetical protein
MQVRDEHRERPLQRGCPTNQHVLVTRHGIRRQHQSRRFTKPSAGAVARYRVAHFAARRYAEPNCAIRLMHRILIVWPPNLQDKSRHRT